MFRATPPSLTPMFQSGKGRIELVVQMLGVRPELVVDGLHLHEKGDHGVMGVDASAGAAVRRPALRLAPHENRALVRPYDLHARRLAVIRSAARCRPEFGPFADFGRAPAPDFLVGGEHEIDRRGEFRRLEGRPRREHCGQGALHVAAPAAVNRLSRISAAKGSVSQPSTGTVSEWPSSASPPCPRPCGRRG